MEKENKFDWSEHKNKVSNLLLKRPEGLAGLAAVAVILSYFILSPSDDEQTSVQVSGGEPSEQSIDLPIPEIDKQESFSVQTPIAQSDSILVSDLDNEDPPLVEEEILSSIETQVLESEQDVINMEMDIPETHETKTASEAQVASIKEKNNDLKRSEKTVSLSPPKLERNTSKKAVKSWVFAKKPDLYTIQLVGSSNQKEIEKFIKANKTQERLSYFHTIKNNKSWYVVVQGSYASFRDAEKARKRLPEKLTKYGPWTRNYLSIQKEITANAEKIILLSNAFANNE